MIEVVTHGLVGSLAVRTEGLRLHSKSELQAEVKTLDLVQPAKDYLIFVANYLLKSGNTIRAGQTLAYGYWLTKFENLTPDLLEVWEYAAEATQFQKGASLTLTYWRDQHAVCGRFGAEFQPPRPDQLTVISEGVLEGLQVQGVRYPAPQQMSGWWITTDRYNGDVSTLKHEHTYHVTAERPELARFMALPRGFRYDLSTHEDVWFDEKTVQVTM
jgi:hypothetical protein